MGEVKDEFDMEPIVKSAIQHNLGSVIVKQIVDDVKNSTQVHNNSRDIIVKLVKRHRAMETKNFNTMNRDYKLKCDEANTNIEHIMKSVDKRLDTMRISCQEQMDEIHEKQQDLIDENNILYKDAETFKSEMSKVEKKMKYSPNLREKSRSEITRLELATEAKAKSNMTTSTPVST